MNANEFCLLLLDQRFQKVNYKVTAVQYNISTQEVLEDDKQMNLVNCIKCLRERKHAI